MQIPVTLFESKAYAPGIFDSYFGGLYLVKGIPLVFQLLLLALYPLSFVLAYLASCESLKQPRRSLGIASILCSLGALTISSFLLFQPWDELFIYLRHAQHWAEANQFSFSRTHPVEGIVDYLVYFIIGTLAKFGIPLLELAHLQSLLGAILCAAAGKKFLDAWKVSGAKYYAFPVFCAFAPLMLNAAHGFTTTMFAAAILWSIYLICFARKMKVGICLVGLVPLIRMEGIWFSLLILAYYYLETSPGTIRPRAKSALAVLSLAPFVLLTLFRFNVYHQLIPAPIRYKACFGSLFYLLMGLRNLLADLIAGYGFLALVALVATFILNPKLIKANKAILMPLLLLSLFILPYYPSGGDWFPSAWGRYLLPWTLLSITVACALISQLAISQRKSLLILLGSILLFQSLASFTAYPKTTELLFTPRRALAQLDLRKKLLRVPYRTHYLSQLGVHLKNSTDPGDVIASSEIATIMFYAKREVLDTLGVTNPEVYQMPLRPTPSLIRLHPREAELPYLIFKRVNPELVRIHRPQILYTFDFMLPELLEETTALSAVNSYDELSPTLLAKAITRWEHKFSGLVGPLYGGVGNLLNLGYHPIVIRYGNDFCALYFVSEQIFQRHREVLKNIGFTETHFVVG